MLQYTAYIDRLTMPKLMICTGGDEFFQNDDSYYYWDKFQGEKYMRLVQRKSYVHQPHDFTM